MPVHEALAESTGTAPALSATLAGRRAARLLTPLTFLAADLLAVSLSATLAVGFWYGSGHPLDPHFYLSQWPVLLAFAGAFAVSGLYTAIALHPAEELRRLAVSTSLVCLSLGAITFLAKEGVAYSRAVFLLTWLGCLLVVPVFRSLIRQVCGPRRWWGYPTVVLGDGRFAQALFAQLQQKPSLGLKPVATAALDSIESYRTRWGIHWVIVAAGDFRESSHLAAQLFHLQRIFPHVIVAPDSAGLPSLRVDSMDLNGILGLEMSHRLLRPGSVRLKQASDTLLAACFALATAPLLLLIALAVRLNSPGPVVFGHARRGRNHRLFKAWKFRTMVVDAEAILARYLSESEEAREQWRLTQKLARDPRVTTVGRWLRRTSLDELPQLWNVLLGEMSLVGPRPIIDAEIDRYGPGYLLYQQVRPGLTGLWQVSGRNRLPYEERVKLDLYYLTNWSLWLDLYILARTIRAVLKGDGAW